MLIPKGYVLFNFIYINFWNDVVLEVVDRLLGLGISTEKRQVWLSKGNMKDTIGLELFSILTSGGYKPTQVMKLCSA